MNLPNNFSEAKVYCFSGLEDEDMVTKSSTP